MRVKAADIAAMGGFEVWHRKASMAANAHPVKSCFGRGQGHGVAQGPNLTEQRYHDEFLAPRVLSGEIVECVFEGLTFELAHECKYTPDWWCRLADGSEECHEVKGAHVWEDGRVKAKVAARMNPSVSFYWCQWKDGAWRIKQIPR